MKKQILFLAAIGFLFSCSDDLDQIRITNMRINHHRNTGTGEGLFLLLQVQENSNIGSDSWYNFYGPIEGFDYQPGFIYDIKVIVEKVDNPLADGSSVNYKLLKIESIQEVNRETPFDMDLKRHGQSFVTTTSGYSLLDLVKIDCDGLCDELDSKLSNQDFVTGTFKRLQSDEIQLIGLE